MSPEISSRHSQQAKAGAAQHLQSWRLLWALARCSLAMHDLHEEGWVACILALTSGTHQYRLQIKADYNLIRLNIQVGLGALQAELPGS